MTSLLDDIAEFFRLKEKKASPFMTLTLEEKALYDKLKFAGLNPTVEDVHAFFQRQEPNLSAHTQVERLTKIEELVEVFQWGDIVNGSFEFDFVGWQKSGAYIETTIIYEGLKSCRLSGVGVFSWVRQIFNPRLKLDKVRKISIMTRVNALEGNMILQSDIIYDDGTNPLITNILPSAIDKWEAKEIEFNSTKKASQLFLILGYTSDTTNAYLDAVKVWR